MLARRLSVALTLVVAIGWSSRASAQEYFAWQNQNGGPLAPEDCNGNGCWTNYNLLVDLDGDDDLDVILPNSDGFFTKGNPQPLTVYENAGNATFTKITGVFGGPGFVRQVATGDIDGDGDIDVVVPSAFADDPAYPTRLFVRDGQSYTEEAAARLPVLPVRAGATRFADVDGDGDLDLFVGDDWAGTTAELAHLFVNDGTGHFADQSSNLPAGVPGGSSNPIDFDAFDADGDFDLDLLINVHHGSNVLWRNDGTGVFTDATAGMAGPGAQSNYHYGPAVCDIDGDGDLDILLDNTGGGYGEQVLVNDGSGAFADESSARIPGNNNIDGADDNGFSCIDVDGDGDLDAAIMALPYGSNGGERLLLNDGLGVFSLVAGGFESAGDSTLWFDFGDLDGDGRLDAVTAQGEGTTNDEVYLGTGAVVDTLPPRLRAVEAPAAGVPNVPTRVRFAVVDNAVTDVGPRLQRAYLSLTAPAAQEIEARFSGGDLFLAMIPGQAEGTTVTFTACAVDRRGNETCSAASSFTVGGGSPSSTSSSGSGSTATGAGGASAATGATTSDATTGVGGGVQGLDDGCGCGIPGTGGRTGGAAMLALVGLLVRRRRRGTPARAR